MGSLMNLAVIFVAKDVSPEWSLVINIFAELDPEDDINIGPGKRHPGLSLLTADGKEEEVNGKEGGEMGTTGLVFEHDESEDKSDD